MRGRKPGIKAFKYNDEHINFLKDNVTGTPYKVLTKMFNERFGTDRTYDQIAGMCKSHGLKNGLKGHVYETRAGHHWTDEQVEYLKSIYHDKERSEILKIFNEHFDLELSFNTIIGKAKRMGLKTGFHPPNNSNKCHKTRYNQNSAKTQFKKGEKPCNCVPIGTVTTRSDGYSWKKIGDNNWKQLHRLTWENENGEISENDYIIFLNGDKSDCRIGNLSLISKAAHLEMSRNKYYTNDPEVTQTSIHLANLNIKIKNMEKKQNERKQ